MLAMADVVNMFRELLHDGDVSDSGGCLSRAESGSALISSDRGWFWGTNSGISIRVRCPCCWRVRVAPPSAGWDRLRAALVDLPLRLRLKGRAPAQAQVQVYVDNIIAGVDLVVEGGPYEALCVVEGESRPVDVFALHPSNAELSMEAERRLNDSAEAVGDFGVVCGPTSRRGFVLLGGAFGE